MRILASACVRAAHGVRGPTTVVAQPLAIASRRVFVVFRLHDDLTAPRGVEHVTHPIRCVRDRLLLRGSLCLRQRRASLDGRPHDDRCMAPGGVEHVADPIRCRRDCDFLRRSPCLQQRGAIFVHRAVFGVRPNLCSASEDEGGADGDVQLPSEVHWSFTKSL